MYIRLALACCFLLLAARSVKAQPFATAVAVPPLVLRNYAFFINVTLGWPTDTASNGEEVAYRILFAAQSSNLTLEEGTFDSAYPNGTYVSSVGFSDITLPATGTRQLYLQFSYNDTFPPAATHEFRFTVWSLLGPLSLLPILLTILLGVFTKDVIVSLFCGTFLAMFLIKKFNPVAAFTSTFSVIILGAYSTPSHISVILFSAALSGMVACMGKSGGNAGLAAAAQRFAAKSKLLAQLTTYGLGWLIFFDDYANAMVVGTSMQPMTDVHFISREKLAFIVDGTAAPIASIAPLSSWIGFELSQIEVALAVLAQEGLDLATLGYETNTYSIFLRTLESRYFPIYMLILQLCLILTQREFGPMLRAERRAVYQHKLVEDDAQVQELKPNEVLEPEDDTPCRWWNAMIPLTATVVVMLTSLFYTGYERVRDNPADRSHTSSHYFAQGDAFGALVWSTFFGSLTAFVLYRFQYKDNNRFVRPRWLGGKADPEPLLHVRESVNVFIEGIKNLTAAVIILILAWSIGSAIQQVQADTYIGHWLSDSVSEYAMPAFVFIISAIISYLTGTAWGTMAILFPVVVPASVRGYTGNERIFVGTISAILAGSVFGDHCTAVSDTTILAAFACKCDLRHHVKTQIPYAVTCAIAATLIGYLPFGYYAWPSYVGIFIGAGVLLGAVLLLGVRVDHPGERRDPLTVAAVWLQRRLLHRKVDMYGRRIPEGTVPVRDGALQPGNDSDVGDDEVYSLGDEEGGSLPSSLAGLELSARAGAPHNGAKANGAPKQHIAAEQQAVHMPPASAGSTSSGQLTP